MGHGPVQQLFTRNALAVTATVGFHVEGQRQAGTSKPDQLMVNGPNIQ